MRWFLQHPDAVLPLVWLGGLVGLRRAEPSLRRTLSALVLVLFAGLGLASALGLVGGISGLVDLEGVTRDGVWWAVAALLLVGATRSDAQVGWASALPLLLVGWHGGGALCAGVLILATAGLEVGRRGRAPLLGGLVLLSLATWLDHDRLGLSLALRRWGLGVDPAVFIAMLGIALTSMLGWAAVLVGVVERLPTGPPAQRLV